MLRTIPPPVSEYLSRRGLSDAHVTPLAGDASDRRYFRVVTSDGRRFVLAVHASPFAYAELPFVNVASLLHAMPVPAPRILDEASDVGVLAIDDLGDVTLQAFLAGATPEARTAAYREAVGLIDVLQRRGAELSSPAFVPYGLAFDVPKLMFEMDFFLEHFLEGHRGATIAPAAREELREALGGLVAALAAEPRVLCHRDYHSRNLMVKDGRLHLIDFQDARMGPDTYDLASLLRDSYVDLPEPLVEEMIEAFVAARGNATEARSFRRRFDAMALQRNLKALGTFGYQASARGNPRYLESVPRTIGYVRETLQKDTRFATVRRALAPHLQELE